jgi:hypothetical protein
MGQITFDEVVVIDWYQSETAATYREANDRLWNATTPALTAALEHFLDAFRSRS